MANSYYERAAEGVGRSVAGQAAANLVRAVVAGRGRQTPAVAAILEEP